MPVKIQTDSLVQMIATLRAASADAPKAIKQAMNAARRKSKADVAAQSSAIYNVDQARISKDLTSKTIEGYNYSIVGRKRKRGPSLISYGATQNGQGLSVVVIKSRGARRIKSGFVNRGLGGEGGNVLAFIRTGAKRKMKAGRYVGQIRQPIKALYGPSVADMLLNNAVYDPISKRFVSVVGDELTKRIQRAFRRG